MGNYWSTLQEHSEVNASCDISDYLAVDNEVLTSGALTLKEIAQACSSSNADEVDSDDEEVAEVKERVPIIGTIARQAYLQLRQFCEENALDEKLYSAFDQIENFFTERAVV